MRVAQSHSVRADTGTGIVTMVMWLRLIGVLGVVCACAIGLFVAAQLFVDTNPGGAGVPPAVTDGAEAPARPPRDQAREAVADVALARAVDAARLVILSEGDGETVPPAPALVAGMRAQEPGLSLMALSGPRADTTPPAGVIGVAVRGDSVVFVTRDGAHTTSRRASAPSWQLERGG